MVNVDKEVSVIIDILKKEYSYYKDLVELSVSKKNIIIEGKVEELDKIVKLEQDMIFNIGKLEQKREEEVTKVCRVLNINGVQITVTELSEALRPELRKELSDIQNKLKETFSELKSVNDVNGQLIKQSLEYIDYSINLIAGSGMETGSLYGNIGKNKNNKKNIFDTKV